MIFEFIHIARAAEEAAAPSGVATLGLHGLNFLGQLVNFGILLLIFWKWILPRVTKGLQERTERIEKSLINAERIEKEKLEFEAWKNEQMAGARREGTEIINQAQIEANKLKDQTLIITKNDQEKIIAQAKAQIEQEKNKAVASAKSELADLVTNATEKIFRHKLDASTDQKLIKESLANVK